MTEGPNFVLKLTSNASTGYAWKVVSTDRTFGYPVKSDYVGAPGAAIGGAGYQLLTWKTKTALSMVGSHTVKLDYVRSFGPATPAKTLTITVKINAAP